MLFELHLHTHYSKQKKVHYDGVDSPTDMIREAKRKGIGAVVVTDHDLMDGVAEAKKAGKKYGVLVIPGEEITSADGHILAIGIQEAIKPGMSVHETVDKIRQHGGFSIGVHPFDIQNDGLGKLAEFCDGIEVFNALSVDRLSNRKTSKFFSHKKAKTAGSDAHCKELVGHGLNRIDADNIDSLIRELKKGNVEPVTRYPSAGTMMAFITRRLQKSKPYVREYIDENYTGAKKHYSHALLNLVDKTPGRIDPVFKAMYYTSLSAVKLYSAAKYFF